LSTLKFVISADCLCPNSAIELLPHRMTTDIAERIALLAIAIHWICALIGWREGQC
jgi:hypothetical protein